MIQSCVIGIDVGTTGTKSVLFSRKGSMLARAYQGYPVSAPAAGRSEQNAEDWWNAVVGTVRTVLRALPEEETVAAIALSVQGGTLVPTDRSFRPLRPAIVWNDSRAGALRSAFPGDSLYQKTGWPAGTGQPLLNLAWLRENEPELFGRAAYFLTVHDYLSARLTGRPAVDLSDAGINQLVDVRAGTYDPELLAFAGVEEARLAELIPSGRPVGYLTEEAAGALGLTTETILISGAHDQYAAALGAGLRPGELLVGSGTSWVLTCLDDRPHFELGLPQSRAAAPGLWGTVVSITTGGICLEWFRSHLAPGWTDKPLSYRELDERAAAVPPGANGLLFYPHLSGAPMPLSNDGARGTLLGLGLSHNSWDVTRAVLEGVVFQLTWLLERLRQNFPVARLRLSGGAAKSPLWTEILSDVTGLPVSVPALPDLPCVGAAILAGSGAGLYSLARGQEMMRINEQAAEPDPVRSAQYQPLLRDYIARAGTVDALYRAEGGVHS